MSIKILSLNSNFRIGRNKIRNLNLNFQHNIKPPNHTIHQSQFSTFNYLFDQNCNIKSKSTRSLLTSIHHRQKFRKQFSTQTTVRVENDNKPKSENPDEKTQQKLEKAKEKAVESKRELLNEEKVNKLLYAPPSMPRRFEKYPSLYAKVVDIVWSTGTTFIGLSTLFFANSFIESQSDLCLVMTSLGSTAISLFALPHADFSQPRNVIFGNLISAMIGVAVYQYVVVPFDHPWFSEALAVAGALGVMKSLKSLHPPAGGVALLAIIGSDQVHQLGFELAIPACAYSAFLVFCALLHNINRTKKYPLQWF